MPLPFTVGLTASGIRGVKHRSQEPYAHLCLRGKTVLLVVDCRTGTRKCVVANDLVEDKKMH